MRSYVVAKAYSVIVMKIKMNFLSKGRNLQFRLGNVRSKNAGKINILLKGSQDKVNFNFNNEYISFFGSLK